MRNLKRVISLALAVVMVIGMMVVGAGAADFSDKAEIDYSEAVAVISGLGIIEGIANGDDTYRFNPDGILTREGAAKLICFMLMGPENAKLLTATKTFNDVKGWSAPFVSYCASLGYIAGNGDGTFNPTGKLTGLAFAKLLLCALGYDAEVEGYVNNKHWATRIAVDAYEAGLNIDGVDLYAQLTREQAAQMMLNTLSAPMVDYKTEVFGGTKHAYETGKTFAEVYFPNLTQFEGVVTANEYADLYDDDALKAGKTEIGGVVYNLSTELTDIGESRQGWANGKKVVFIEDTGDNTVLSTGEATKIDAKFVKANGITGATEYFVDFDNAYIRYYTSDWRIAYGADPAGTLTVFKAGDEISAAEYATLKNIFNNDDDEYDGWVVYVGTQRDEDISDTLSFNQFADKYLEAAYDLTTEVEETGNGEWLKVVDNDGDGKADYVFVTEFTMAEVADLSKKGVLELDNNKTFGGVKDLPFVTSDELAKGDVVIYTTIDGVCYVDLAENFEATVKKYNYKNEIMTTTDGEEYAQSGINDQTGFFYDELVDLDDETYIFYVDHFGYIRVAAEPAEAADEYVLVTEFYGDNKNHENLISSDWLIAEVVDTEGEAAEYEVAYSKLSKDWVADTLLNKVDDENHVLSVAGTDSWTNVAAYELEDELISLYTAKNEVLNSKKDVVAETDYIALKNEVAKGQQHFAIADGHAGKYINVTQNTLVFYVLGKGADKIYAVDVVTGYKNIVKVDNINAVYAVADRTDIDTEYNDYYWEAQILVIEAEDYEVSYKDALAFVYSNPEKETSKVFSLESIAADGALDVLYVENNFAAGQYVADSVNPLAFYPTYEDEDGFDVLKAKITENYAKKNIFAGEFKRYQEASKMDYIDVIINGKPVSVAMPATAVAYSLSQGKNDTFDADVLDLTERTNEGDKIIYVTDKAGKIVYIIDVDTSFVSDLTTDDAAADTLEALWQDIVDEATAVVADSNVKTATTALTAITAVTADNVDAAKAAVEAAKAAALTPDENATVAELADLNAAIADVEKLIDAYENPVGPSTEETAAAEQALLEAYNAYKAAKTEDQPAALLALYEAAVAAKTAKVDVTTNQAAGAGLAYKDAAGEAKTAVEGVTKADLTKLAGIKAGIDAKAGVNAAALTLNSTTQADYDAAVAKIDALADEYAAAEALVLAYNAYKAAAIPTDALKADLLAALPSATVNTAICDTVVDEGSYTFGVASGNTYSAAYTDAAALVPATPVDAAVVLELTGAAKTAKATLTGSGNAYTLTVGVAADKADEATEIAAMLQMTTASAATTTASGLTAGTLTGGVWTITFAGKAGGKSQTVNVTVKVLTAAEKQAADVAELKAALAALDVSKSLTVATVEASVPTAVDAAVKAISLNWGSVDYTNTTGNATLTCVYKDSFVDQVKALGGISAGNAYDFQVNVTINLENATTGADPIVVTETVTVSVFITG